LQQPSPKGKRLLLAHLKILLMPLPIALSFDSFGRELASPTNNTMAKTNNIFVQKTDGTNVYVEPSGSQSLRHSTRRAIKVQILDTLCDVFIITGNGTVEIVIRLFLKQGQIN